MEVLISIIALPLILLSLYAAFKNNSKIAKITFAGFVLVELIIISTVFWDWGYLWVEMPGYSLAFERNIWILVPQLMAFIVLVVVIGSNLRHAWLGFILSIIQIPLIFLSIYYVELDIDMSVLTPASVTCMVGSALSSILLIPTVVRVIPPENTRLWHIVFGPRKELLEGIKTIAETFGLTYKPPQSILESGSACGKTEDGIDLCITTRPSVWPAGYALNIRVGGKLKTDAALSIKDLTSGMSGSKHLVIKDDFIQYSCVIKNPHAFDYSKFFELVQQLLNAVQPTQ